MKIGNLVKVRDCEVNTSFAHIKSLYQGDGKTVYVCQHVDDNELIHYVGTDLELYDYEDMLKELIMHSNYGSSRFLALTKNSLQIDGINLDKDQAIHFANSILEFYHA